MLRLLQHPVLLVLLCFSLIGTPVTYRGGASNPHPHMFFEFLIDARDGHFDHHHHGEDADMADEGHDDHSTMAAVQDEPVDSQVADVAEHFGASLSACVVGDVGQLAFILPEHALPQQRQIETAFAQADRILTGVTHSPIAPPPR
jgi:hypothetical protein